MRSFPKPPIVKSGGVTIATTTSNGGAQSNDGSCCFQDSNNNGRLSHSTFIATVKKKPASEFYHGDPEAMDSVNLLNTNKEKCQKLLGTETPNLERKIYFFDTLDMIRVLRDPSKEIDVVQYEYQSGSMCFLVGEEGFKEELIRKQFLYVHECMLCSPVKLFIDIDCEPPPGCSENDYNALNARVRQWIERFKAKAQDVIENLVISVMRQEASDKKKRKKKKENEVVKFKHEWSVQCANRPPSPQTHQTKISFHVINNSSYDKKPILLSDVIHVDAFLKKNILRDLDSPKGFNVDGSFTFRGKTLRCFGAAKRGEPERVFVDTGRQNKPFAFHCVQFDRMTSDYYVISTVPSDQRFDVLYPETDFLLGSYRRGGTTTTTSGGGTGGNNTNSLYPCNVKLPKNPDDVDVCNDFIRSVVLHLQEIDGYRHIARETASGRDFPYKTYNIKTDPNREKLDIGIIVNAGACCLLGKRQHSGGKKSTSMQLCLFKGPMPGTHYIRIRCKGGINPPDHPIEKLDVSRLSGGIPSKKKHMLDMANAVAVLFFGGSGDQMATGEI